MVIHGDGKTQFALKVGSIVTNDCKFPTGRSDIESGNVIYQTAEDGLGDTIKPRLISAGANQDKVIVIDESEEPLSLTDTRIEEAITKFNAKILIIDPIQAYLGADVDMHRANEIRPIMHHLSVVAERTGCAIILIGHMNKDDKKSSPLNKGLGSIDIVASARSVLLLGRNPKNENVRVVIPIKSSLAPEAKGVAFELKKDTGFKWIGESELTARDLLDTSKKSKTEESVIEEVKPYILELFKLKAGDISVKETKELLKNVYGFSDYAIRGAIRDLKIKTYSKGFKPKEYYWKNPKTEDKK